MLLDCEVRKGQVLAAIANNASAYGLKFLPGEEDVTVDVTNVSFMMMKNFYGYVVLDCVRLGHVQVFFDIAVINDDNITSITNYEVKAYKLADSTASYQYAMIGNVRDIKDWTQYCAEVILSAARNIVD